MQSDVERIAAGLSEAQRWILLRHAHTGPDFQHHWLNVSARDPLSWNVSGRGLRTHGLLRWTVNPRQTATELTPLGLAVRAHLQEQSK